MLFSWTYILIVILTTVAYYSYFKKHPSLYFTIISLLVISYWDLNSAALAVILTGITYLSKVKFRKTTRIAIGLHLLILITFKTELLWLGDSNPSEQNQVFIFLGLSYFTLQNISVLLDHDNKTNLSQLMIGNLFFPKFIAGPILVSKDLSKIQWSTSIKTENIAAGTQRILYGLAKKLILADRLSIISNNILHAETQYQNLFTITFSSIVFTIQMYIDFSAYSDIAIGTAKLFGIDLKENFKLPLRSKSISEYWRKTHVSLIEWLTHHVYYPIVYRFRTHTYTSVALAILATFTLSGYWHGSYIGYIIWGVLNGIYVLFEYTWKKNKLPKLNGQFGLIATLLFIAFSNLFFKVKTWDSITAVFSNITSNKIIPINWMTDFVAIIGNGGHLIQQYNLLETTTLLLIFLLFENKLEEKAKNTQFSYLYLSLIILSTLFFGNFNAGDEFIYVQF